MPVTRYSFLMTLLWVGERLTGAFIITRGIPKWAAHSGRSGLSRRDYHRWRPKDVTTTRVCTGSYNRFHSQLDSTSSRRSFRLFSSQNEDHVQTTTTRIRKPSIRLGSEEWAKDLNEAQLEAVTKPVYSINRVVAGPGSGKTRVLTSRIAYLLKEDPKARILAVTFTKKAAMEMQQRLETLLSAASHADHHSTEEPNSVVVTRFSSGENNNNEDKDDNIREEEYSEGHSAYVRDLGRTSLGTFHKVCANILRYNGNLLQSLPSIQEIGGGGNVTTLDGNFAIMDQSDQLKIMKECLADLKIDPLKAKDVKPLLILNALADIKKWAVTGGGGEDERNNKKPVPVHRKIAQKIYSHYRGKMLSNNLLDFDDLIYLTRELLMTNQGVRQAIHRRWTHVLVDEYQDTSRAQIDLVRLWTSTSLFVVGDGDQSIYAWRGAEANSLSSFDDEFTNFLGEVGTVHLTENYRSTSEIVHASQKVIASGDSSRLRRKATPKRGRGSPPRIVACNNGKAEASFAVKTIKSRLASGQYTQDTTVAILYRANSQSRELEEACVKNNLPYVILGKANSFYKRREVKDSLCFLRWLYNGRDKVSMLRSFQTPSRGLGDKAVEKFHEYYALVEEAYTERSEAPPTPLEILISFCTPEEEGLPSRKDTIPTRPLNIFTEFAHQMRAFVDLAYSAPLESVLAAVISDFGLEAHFDKMSDTKEEFRERMGNVNELLHATKRYSNDGPCLKHETSTTDGTESPLGSFLDDVALVTELSNEEAAEKKRFVVSLMTIHCAKGMEFDSVFVCGNEDGNFPTHRALNEGEGSVALAEECRLCYVAMTRAKSDLFLTWRREAAIFGQGEGGGMRIVQRERSRFLDTLVKEKKGASDASSSRDSDIPSRRRKVLQTPGNNNRSYSTASRNYPPSGRSSSDYPIRSPRRNTNASTSTSRRLGDPRSISVNGVSKPRRNGKAKATSPVSRSAAMDSTWFFPVGSSVQHKKWGKGIVLDPPASNKLLVRVEFGNGKSLDLPSDGGELMPDFSP
ncbi:helicase PcrA [Seminavis robusta]|uniref:DNA 3'-5' helicase n=1 Tax=Seminavis robusta TaxID=568900 RepID=A0A9N8EJL2_9STRA|nr:helicase PcrA [Seminavis robusta]|eukprot:Sro1091_g240230.1 helicase PcrA (1025) ;mRNA; r:1296-4894